MRGTLLALVCWLLIGLNGCQGGNDEPIGVSRAALRAVESCSDLETLLRENAVAEMRAEVLRNYQAALDGQCYETHYPPPDGDVDADSDGDTDADGPSDYSTTNTQEDGVDEADFVKTDGTHVFIVAGQELLIIEAWPAPATEVVARVELRGRPRLLYVHEDRALVYADTVDEETDPTIDDCYRDEFRGEWVCGATSRGTRVSIFDITDREHPVLERELELSGLYVDSRRIADSVHTVMTYPGVSFPGLSMFPAGLDRCPPYDRSTLWAAFAALLEQNELTIMESPIDSWVPTVTDIRYAADGSAEADSDVLGDCEGFYDALGTRGRDFLSVVSLDMLAEGGEVHVASIVGDQGVVYASHEALYVASRQYHEEGAPWFFDADAEIGEATTVHRFLFDRDSPATTYDASGVVAGRVLNQFSMGEHQGFLRMATTVGYLPDPECSNNVYVLESRGGVLEIAGEITGIAPSEDIRSARFVGNRGFVVTFKKTDPLFTLDLSNPEAPSIEGELHIPGYSTYMHMLDEDHLLSIGFDAQDEGDFAWFQGVLLQIFDVSDMAAPARTHLEVIGTRGTSSEATANHLAFNYFRPRDLLAIPMALCEGGGGGSYGDEMTFNGLLVYDVTVGDGFTEHGRVSHGDPEGYTCSNWWTNPSSHVKRSIIMDDYVFSIAADQMIVAHLDDLATPLVSVELPMVPDGGDSYGY